MKNFILQKNIDSRGNKYKQNYFKTAIESEIIEPTDIESLKNTIHVLSKRIKILNTYFDDEVRVLIEKCFRKIYKYMAEEDIDFYKTHQISVDKYKELSTYSPFVQTDYDKFKDSFKKFDDKVALASGLITNAKSYMLQDYDTKEAYVYEPCVKVQAYFTQISTIINFVKGLYEIIYFKYKFNVDELTKKSFNTFCNNAVKLQSNIIDTLYNNIPLYDNNKTIQIYTPPIISHKGCLGSQTPKICNLRYRAIDIIKNYRDNFDIIPDDNTIKIIKDYIKSLTNIKKNIKSRSENEKYMFIIKYLNMILTRYNRVKTSKVEGNSKKHIVIPELVLNQEKQQIQKPPVFGTPDNVQKAEQQRLALNQAEQQRLALNQAEQQRLALKQEANKAKLEEAKQKRQENEAQAKLAEQKRLAEAEQKRQEQELQAAQAEQQRVAQAAQAAEQKRQEKNPANIKVNEISENEKEEISNILNGNDTNAIRKKLLRATFVENATQYIENKCNTSTNTNSCIPLKKLIQPYMPLFRKYIELTTSGGYRKRHTKKQKKRRKMQTKRIKKIKL
jgi:hypothetical protein